MEIPHFFLNCLPEFADLGLASDIVSLENRLQQCFKSQQVTCREVTKLLSHPPKRGGPIVSLQMIFCKKEAVKFLFIVYARTASVYVMATSEFILGCAFPSAVSSVAEKQCWKFKRQGVKNILLTRSCHVCCKCINFCLNDETGRPVKQQSICNGILHVAS